MAMNEVSVTNPAYDRGVYSWVTVRDSIEGEAAVKGRGTMYLPMPAAMQFTEYANSAPSFKTRTGNNYYRNDPLMNRLSSTLMDPNYHSNPAYAAYLSRAQFPELTGFILRGLLGLAMGDEPTMVLPKSMEYLYEKATPTGMTLVELYSKALVETLITGKFTMIADKPENDEELLIVPYAAESLINWKTRRSANTKGTDITFMVLEEYSDDDQTFDHDPRPNYVVPRDLGNMYVVEKYDESSKLPISVVTPSYKGRTIDYVPSVTIGSISNGMNPNPIPLYSIASTSMQIYMRTADLGNSEFLSCNPTLVMTGVDSDNAPKALGSTVVITCPNEQAKVFYTETDTSALSHVMSHIDGLFERAVYFGAQLLDSSKKAAESAETTRLKQASSGATLSSVVSNVAHGMEKQLKMIARWKGEDPDLVEFKPITEFMAPALTAQEQKAMVESWTAGAISKVTLLDNFRRAGLLPAGSSVEDEMTRISAEPPVNPEGSNGDEGSSDDPNTPNPDEKTESSGEE